PSYTSRLTVGSCSLYSRRVRARRDFSLFFFFRASATPESSTLSLHDALPICSIARSHLSALRDLPVVRPGSVLPVVSTIVTEQPDRKSTRLNSSHGSISYAVFCLKKKKKEQSTASRRPSVALRPRHDLA